MSSETNFCPHFFLIEDKRFGKGIYTSACSSSMYISRPIFFVVLSSSLEADDYTKNLSRHAKHHVLLLNRVALGKSFPSQRNAQHLTSPPPGFHSVLGVPGIHLNYEETVVYSNDAIRPGYVLVYGEPPTTSRGGLRRSLRRIFNTPVVS